MKVLNTKHNTVAVIRMYHNLDHLIMDSYINKKALKIYKRMMNTLCHNNNGNCTCGLYIKQIY